MSTFSKLAALSLVLSAPAVLAQDDAYEGASDDTSSASKGPGFAVGIRAGYGIPLGNATGSATEDGEGNKLSDAVSGMIPLQLDLGYFINSNLYVGGSFQYGIGFLPSDLADSCDASDASCSVSQMRFGLNLAYHFAPNASINPWLGVGVGYETLTLSQSGEVMGVDIEASTSVKGFEFVNAQGGLDFAVSPTISVGPFVTFTVAQYSSASLSGEGGGEEVDESNDIENTAIHSWLYGGVRLQARF
jgi:outer membrane protein W